MKNKYISGIFAVLLPLYAGGIHLAWGQSPPGLMNFQGRLTDESNNPLSGPHNFVFEVYDSLSGGSQLWTETQNGITVANGVLAAQLGAANAIPAEIFAAPSAYLQITVDGTALSPRQRLVTAPYAFNADSLQGRGYAAFVSTDSAAQTIAGDKTFTGPLSAAQLRLSGNVSVSSESLSSLGAGVRISTNIYIVGFSSAAKYYGDGSALTGINPAGDNLGSHVASLNLNMSGRQIINVASMTVTGKDADSGYSIFLSSGINMAGGTVNAGLLLGDGGGLYNLLASSVAAGGVRPGSIAAGAISAAAQIADGTITLAKFSQSGCSDNQVPKWNGAAWACAADVGGTAYTADESALHLSGGVFSALSSSVTLQGNSFNSANRLLRLDGSGYLPALNGSQLTNVGIVQFSAVATDTTTIAGGLAAEITNRAGADASLSGRLDTVAVATAALRTDINTKAIYDDVRADTATIAGALSSEATNRANADTALSGRFNTVAVDTATLKADINTKAIYEDVRADTTTIAGGLSAESANRAAADTALSGRLTTVAVDTATLRTDLNAKAADGSVVHLASAETITGVKTFSSNPLLNADAVPQSAISGLTAALASKAAYEDVRVDTTTIAGGLSSEATNRANADTALSGRLNTIAVDTTTLRIDLNAKAADGSVVHLASAETITGVKTFSADPVFNAAALPQSAISGLTAVLAAKAVYEDVRADTTTIAGGLSAELANRSGADTALSGRLSTVAADTATLRTDLNAKSADSSVVHLASAETITGVKTFSADPVFNAAAVPQAAISGLTAALAAKAVYEDVRVDTTTIAGGLSSEATNRANADTALSGRLNTVGVDTTTLKTQLDLKANLASPEFTGNVGIGTAGAGNRLEVANGSFMNPNSSTAGVLISGDSTSNSGYMGTRFTLNNTNANFAGFIRAVRTSATTFIGMELGSETDHGIRFLTNGTADTAERMRIDNAGNVGIGTAAPGALFQVGGGTLTATAGGYVGIGQAAPANVLHVTGNVEDMLVRLHNNSATYNQTGIRFRAQSPANANAHADLGFKATGSEAGYLFFRAPYNSTERMVIDTAGNVGIGTSAPGAKTEINGFTSGQGLWINYGSAAGEIEAVTLKSNGLSSGRIGLQMVDASNADMWLGASSGRAMTIYRNGNVGVGTTAPGAKLEVNGNLKVGDNLIIGGSSGYKVYQNLASLDNYSGPAGALVIDTNMPFTAANMFTITISGYSYGGTGPWEVTVAAYAGENNIYSARYVSVNKAGFGAPVIARNATTGMVAVILGTTAGTWNYQITVSKFTQGFNGQVESYADGWTITPRASLANYDYQTTCADGSTFTGLIQSTAPGTSYMTGGNVGIGTAAPGQKLEVMAPTGSPAASGTVQNGILRVQGSTGGNGLDIGVLSGSPYATWMQAGYKGGDLSINYPLLLNPNGGNVGIGTTGPGAVLDVAGTSNFTQKSWTPYGSATSISGYTWTDAAINTTSIEIVNNQGTVSNLSPTLAFHRYGSGGPQFRLDAAGTNVLYLESANPNSARNPNAYGGGANSYFSRLHIDGQLSTTGSVGIGTTSLGTAKLAVNGNLGLSGTSGVVYGPYFPDTGSHSGELAIQAGFGSSAAGGSVELFGQSHATNAGYVRVGLSASGAKFAVNTGGISSGTDIFTVQRDGNVGVGLTSPGHQLQVGVADGAAQAVTIRGYSNTPASWKGGAAFGYTGASVIMGELGGVAQIAGHTASLGAWADLAINSGGGNVGIGTTSPSSTAKLHVAGDIIGNAQVFKAYMTADLSKGGGTWEKVPFNATLFNTLKGTFDTGNNRFIASRAGYYRISVTGYSTTGGTGTERYAIGLQKNGSLEGFTGGNYSASDTPLSGLSSIIVYLNGSTDYVEIWAFSAIAATWKCGSSGGHVMFWYMDYMGA